MESIRNVDVKNKTIILRCDFNVTIKDNKIIDDTKIISSLKTIELLLKNNNKLIILSHLGKVKTEEDLKKNTLYPVYLRLKELIDTKIYFSPDTRGENLENIINNANYGEIVLVENTRYEDLNGKKESSCDNELSKYWASLGNVFVNDAFGSSHRKHASTYGIKKYLKSYYGLLIDEEINKLQELINNDKHPFTVIMGGAKVEDKLELISELLKKCDNLIVGGGIANTFMYAKNFNIGKSLVSLNNIVEIKELINKYNDKIITPLDFYVENDENKKYRKLEEINNEDIIYDVGPLSLERYKGVIDNSKIIFINGTMGLYENANYKYGTEELLKELANSNGKVFVGGGDAVSATNKLGYKDAFYYKSTGGGATLEYIISKRLAALED